jgi:MarR-like DNA-binding transcriptional regulator SgrR of sgrS sRNA
MRAAVVAFVTACLAATVLLAQEVPKKRVLLAWEQTDFKQALVEEMERLLTQQGCEVTKALHAKRGLEAKAAEFDAVFITNSGVHSKVRPWITEWLAANKAQAARVLLHTTQTRDWKVLTEVDAITSASSKGDVKPLAADYAARIGRILAPADAK